jgi:membrane protein
MPSPKDFGHIFRVAFTDLRNNDPLRMASATAFFTTFALPAILIIFIQIFGLVLDPKIISDHLFEHLADILGTPGVNQIKETLIGFRKLANNWFITIGGFIFLMFVATTLFKVIRDSLNQLWSIRVHPDSGVRFSIVGRLRSMAVIMLAGLLFLASLVVEGVQALLLDYINEIWKGSATVLYAILNQLVSTTIVIIWFTIVFRYLGNGHPPRKVAIAGGIFTGILFTIGKLILGLLLGYSNIDNIYGASGSFVLVLLFVFYASFILYFGATFTKAWGEYTGKSILAGKKAYKYEVREV